MRFLAWMTDIHLNFLRADRITAFLDNVKKARPDALLITGDIGEAHDVLRHLELIGTYFDDVPVYFVLGNHDYYGDSIVAVRERVSVLTQDVLSLTWLPAAGGVVPLTESTCLIGHDGWADGRFGDFKNSKVMLNDYQMISELKGHTKSALAKRLKALSAEASDYFEATLPLAVNNFQNVIVATHVPPFKEACWHEGKMSSDEYLPHFSCKAVGDVLKREMKNNPKCNMTVLCGHTHGGGTVRVLPNLLVKTGGAFYGRPMLNELVRVF